MDKVLDTKRTYTGYDGEEYIDMCIPAVDVSQLQGVSVIRVNQDENGRIDNFVWREGAENMNMIDLVMYANHIFNPFSIKSEDLLNVPLDDDSVYVSTDEPSLPDGTKMSTNASSDSKTYAETVEYLAKMGLGIK